MSADIVQNLYLGALMDGLSFTVTDVITSVPDATGWTAAFTSESVGKRQSGPSGDLQGDLTLPFQVKATKDGKTPGLIGYTTLSPGSNLSAKGQGGQVDIKFRIQGNVTVKGVSKTVSEYGYITVSASDWKGDGTRPVLSKVTYFWPKSSQIMVTLSPNPNTGTVDNLYVVHVVMPDASLPTWVGMAMTKDTGMAAKALAYNDRGGFLIHETLLGWVSGGLTQ